MKQNIDSKRLIELERAEAKLRALENGGVDNWENYDDALKEYRETIEHDERLEELLSDLLAELGAGAYEPSERGAGFSFSDSAQESAMKVLKLYKIKFEEE